MHRLNRMAFTNTTQMLFDLLTLLVAFMGTHVLLSTQYLMDLPFSYLWILILFTTVMFSTMLVQDMYSKSMFNYQDRIIRNIFFSCLIAAIVCVALLPSVKELPYQKRFLGTYILMCTVLLTIQWLLTTKIILKRQQMSSPHAIFIGNREGIQSYMYYIGKTSFGIKAIGFIPIDDSDWSDSPRCLGRLDELETILGREVVDEVIFALPHNYVGKVEKLMQMCESRGLTVKVALDFNNMSFAKSCITSVGTIPVITYHTVSLNDGQIMLKRGMDIIGAIVGLILTVIVSIFIVPAIKLDSPGPVLFKQKRMGKNGRTFFMYKFRSMCNDAEHLKAKLAAQNEVKDGMMFKIKDDPRITRVGAFIRKTSIDELPQFINVLKGDMSLVGTRPPTMDEVSKYENFHHRRISIKPGLTGLWQISGRSNITDFDQVVELDTLYIDNWSVWKDVSILLRTVWMIVKRKQGAY